MIPVSQFFFKLTIFKEIKKKILQKIWRNEWIISGEKERFKKMLIFQGGVGGQ
jgi:isoleucyl-tRNA synthetase